MTNPNNLHLVLNHPFLDGNKRVAVACALLFLDINGITVTATVDDLEAIIIQAAKAAISKAEVGEFFRTNCE